MQIYIFYYKTTNNIAQ